MEERALQGMCSWPRVLLCRSIKEAYVQTKVDRRRFDELSAWLHRTVGANGGQLSTASEDKVEIHDCNSFGRH